MHESRALCKPCGRDFPPLDHPKAKLIVKPYDDKDVICINMSTAELYQVIIIIMNTITYQNNTFRILPSLLQPSALISVQVPTNIFLLNH